MVTGSIGCLILRCYLTVIGSIASRSHQLVIESPTAYHYQRHHDQEPGFGSTAFLSQIAVDSIGFPNPVEADSAENSSLIEIDSTAFPIPYFRRYWYSAEEPVLVIAPSQHLEIAPLLA